MSSVVMPQQKQKQSGLSSLLQIGGAVAGGVTGGLPGASAGAGMGSMVGGMVDNQKPKQEVNAMGRRAQRMQESNANLNALRQAEVAVAQLPPDQQKQYAPQIIQAKKMAESEMA